MGQPTCVLLLGAGASHGCATTKNQTDKGHIPPLASGLFKMTPEQDEKHWWVMSRVPGAMHVAHMLEHVEQADDFNIESMLSSIANSEVEIDQQSFTHLPIYLSSLFGLISTNYVIGDAPGNYYTLIRKLWHNAGLRVAAVSLNYDTLLESAITQLLGYEFDRIHSYHSRHPVAVHKPHGSWNWRQKMQIQHLEPNERLFTLGKPIGEMAVSRDDALNILSGLRTHQPQVHYPVLTSPILKKKSVWTDPMKELFYEYARDADRLLVIGSSCWDNEIIADISDSMLSTRMIHIVNAADGERLTEIVLRFTAAWGQTADGVVKPISMTFGEYLSSKEFAEFMRA